MCRAGKNGHPGRRCPGDSAGSGGCDYVDERIRQSVDPDAETQKFSKVHKEVVEELQQNHSKEDIERAVGPQDFENFHRVVSKMINQSDMTEHDKMIARKKWNRAEEEVRQHQVSYATLATWQKVLAGTALFMIDRMASKGGKVNWRSINRALSVRVPIGDFQGGEKPRVVPEGFASYEDYMDFLQDDDDYGKSHHDKPKGDDDHDDDHDDHDKQEDDHDDSHEDDHDDEFNYGPTIINATPASHLIPEKDDPDYYQNQTSAQSNKPASEWNGPVSFARRPKSERGAHKAGKPVAEEVKLEELIPSTNTQQIPKVTVTSIPEN